VSEAYELLTPVYGWFTEGFDTKELKEARALLDKLGEPALNETAAAAALVAPSPAVAGQLRAQRWNTTPPGGIGRWRAQRKLARNPVNFRFRPLFLRPSG
jgi:hypothetical protein